MKSYEAINKAIGRDAVEHAKELHLSSSQIHKWMEPSTDFTDSGSFNPLDRINTVIKKSLSLGAPFKDAHAPLYWLSQECKHISIQIPDEAIDFVSVSHELLQLVSEFGDVVRESTEAMKQEGISRRRELPAIKKEVWELIRQAMRYLKAVESCAK